MCIGINLLWLKPKAMGGVEIFTKNLLSGLSQIDKKNEYVIFINKDTYGYLCSEMSFPKNFSFILKNWDPFNVPSIMMKQMLFMSTLANSAKIDVLYHPTPIYPITRIKNLPQIVTFHDLQFLHFPEYATYLQRLKYRLTWKFCLDNSEEIIAISEFTRMDIIRNFHIDPKKVKVIYNPVVLPETCTDFDELSKRYSIRRKEYFILMSCRDLGWKRVGISCCPPTVKKM